MGRFIGGALVGLLMVFAVGVWPAHATVDQGYTKVTAPAAGSVLRGFYEADGTAKAFEHTIRGQAKTDCPDFSSIKFSITGPNDYSLTFPTMSSNSATWSGGPSSPWDTQDLEVNGVYSIKMTVTDRDTLLCSGNQTYPTKADVKVANAPVVPEWSGAPNAAADGSANVSLKWKKNPEGDIVNYHVTRTGPGSADSNTAVVPASACGGSTCEISDVPSNFPAEYSGTYTYQITAFRSAPDGTGEECAPGSSADCVKSNSSEIKSVSLTKPTPSPTPSPTDPPGTSPSPTPGGGNSGSGSNSSNGTRNTRVLSFGGGGGNEFYSGTFDQNLPYQPKTLVLGGGRTTAPNGRQTEAAVFQDEPPNYRTIMLPVAGGLLAFLSAAHVRRLLVHF